MRHTARVLTVLLAVVFILAQSAVPVYACDPPPPTYALTVTKSVSGAGFSPDQMFGVSITTLVRQDHHWVPVEVASGSVSVNTPLVVRLEAGTYTVTETSPLPSFYSVATGSQTVTLGCEYHNHQHEHHGNACAHHGHDCATDCSCACPECRCTCDKTVTLSNLYTDPAPVANPDTATTAYMTLVEIPVLNNDTDPDGDVLHVEGLTSPANGDVSNEGTHVHYTPDEGFSGTDTFTYTASDDHGNVTLAALVTVTVTPRPVATLYVKKVIEGDEGYPVQPFWIDIYDEEGDWVAGDWITPAVSDGIPFHLPPDTYYVVEDTTSPKMPADFTFSRIEYPADEGPSINCVDPQPQTGHVHLGPNDATVTVYNHYTAPTGTLTIHKDIIGDNGWDPNRLFDVRVTPVQEFSISQVEPDYTDGTISANYDWTFLLPPGEYLVEELQPSSPRYTPVDIEVDEPELAGFAALNDTESPTVEGVISTYVHVYGGETSTVTITNRYTVPFDPPPSNTWPDAVNDTSNTASNTPVTINVLVNDTDPDGDTLVITNVTAPANGTAVISAGQVVYTPTTGFSGVDTFTYTIADGNGGSDTATVTVTVVAPPPPPPPPPIIPEPIPTGPAELPNTGGTDPLLFAGIGLALSVLGFLLKKR